MKHLSGFSLLVLALAAVLCTSLITAYPSGSPKCTAQVPKHSSHKAQTSPSPYKVTVSGATKDKNGKSNVAVTISGSADNKFKGFFLYASKPDANEKIGMFTKAPKTTVLTCGSSSAITHSDNSTKTSVTMTWTAPDNFSGNVEFRATVVKEFKEFWTGIKSTPVAVA